ncbi:MAG TPA: pyridoxine 5'-phosphate synthase [Kiritimatiellia bacterium]|nr:pyridoxine 5'-phosphate synthase [Kiritimatiellia bacterium]
MSERFSGLLLGVNIDHVATLRQVRGTRYPDLVEAARLCREGGAVGLTVHLREDRRHIQDADVRRLRAASILPMNLEMGNHREIVEIALEVKPAEVCLVPERREELTTEGGLDVAGQREALGVTVGRMAAAGIAVSLFIDPEEEQIDASVALGVPMIELHTGAYCEAEGEEAEVELARLVRAAKLARQRGLQVNAGHGIAMSNLGGILEIPGLHTLNVGHSLVCRAVMIGLRGAVEEMVEALAGYRGAV